jgi:hypothetical protein
MASVTTTDIYASLAARDAAGTPAGGAGTICFVIQGGKAVQYVWLTTAVGAAVTGWHKPVAR